MFMFRCKRQLERSGSNMAAIFCGMSLSTMLSKLIFLSYFCFIFATESTVFTKEEGNKSSENGAVFSSTGTYSSAYIEDTMFTDGGASTQSATEVKDSSINTDNENVITSGNQTITTVNNLSEHSKNVSSIANETNINSVNISELAANSTNETMQPFWSCAKYNLTQQNVIVLKDKSGLVWWLDELNKTAGCAVVLFYAKWCYFSSTLAPIYNAVGRAFSGIPILAIDAYTHNSLNTRYGIVGVPTIILFQESRPVARFNRSRTFKDLVEFIHQSTGMEYNTSVEVSPIDYEEGALPSTPSDEFNYYLFASLCFLLCLVMFVLWRLQYVQVFVEYFMALTRTLLPSSTEREKND